MRKFFFGDYTLFGVGEPATYRAGPSQDPLIEAVKP